MFPSRFFTYFALVCFVELLLIYFQSDLKEWMSFGIEQERSIKTVEKKQDDTCARLFEWSMIDHWEDNQRPFDLNKVPDVRKLEIPAFKNKRKSQLRIDVFSNRSQVTLVDVRHMIRMSKPFQGNLWHRMMPQYNAWMSVQVAERRYNLKSNRTVFLQPCDPKQNHTLEHLPTEWTRIGECICSKEDIDEQPDVVITPPDEGFLWNLAWDNDFECHHSDMFKAFASLFVDKSSPDNSVGCFISRQGRPIRTVTNFNEIMDMMHEVFSRVRVLHFQKEDTIDNVVDTLYDCRVLFGIHGAGHMNAVFARPGVAVVEVLGGTGPQYFKNVNMLLGQYYEAIIGDEGKKMEDQFNVNVTEAKDALERALDHAIMWEEEHGYWR